MRSFDETYNGPESQSSVLVGSSRFPATTILSALLARIRECREYFKAIYNMWVELVVGSLTLTLTCLPYHSPRELLFLCYF